MSQTIANIARSNDRAAPAAALHVEVIADLICPFCYLGKRRLDDAMQAVQGPSEISWHPYQLNPDMPPQGMSFEDYLASRFGNPVNIQPVLDGLMTEGNHEDIDFRFDKITHVPNTMSAHQLMHLAETEGKDQSVLGEDLMAAFLERGANIGDVDVLVNIAAKSGLKADDVRRVITDDQVRQIVLSREAQVRSSGMAGVPGFLLNRRLMVLGAQSTENLINAFDRAMFGEGEDEFVSATFH